MIMEMLGHSSIRVTMDVYTFVRLDSQRSAFDRVGDALRDGDGPDDDDGAGDALVAVRSRRAAVAVNDRRQRVTQEAPSSTGRGH
ncbi:hypothetical protein ABTY63_07060 [Streptomyces solisilvae]|uniref:hypothetical protein n=1 Tax=Streptomyces malaysiensis TaxID=92644 RepID=UPI003334713F